MAVQGESQAPWMKSDSELRYKGACVLSFRLKTGLKAQALLLYGDDGTDGIMPQVLPAFCAGCGFEPIAQERKRSLREIIQFSRVSSTQEPHICAM